MIHHDATHYDLDCLQQLLDDALPEAFSGEVADHVATCASCREQLELLAGQPDWWSQTCQRARTILADPVAYFSDGDHRTPAFDSGPGADGPSSGSGSHESVAEAFATEFAIDFLAPSDDPALLGRLGDYEILEIIGRGGMGIVLKGFQKELNRYVALKVLAPHLAMCGAARRRFEREAQATAAIVNPHVMAIHAVAANARLPYLVMPFVACESLQQRLDRQGPLDVKDVLRIGMQAALGLAAAHAQGLVHRDVKPANILLETSVDRVLLTDFGLARATDDASLTRTGVIAGTPQYMSPEQAGGDAIDHRSDLFSLGSVLYAATTGRPPFRAETMFGVLRRIRETSPRPIREINPDIPEWLERIVLRLLSKHPSDRFATATEIATLLERCLAHVQQPTVVELPTAIGGWSLLPVCLEAEACRSGWTARHPARWIVLASVLLIAIGLAVWWRPLSPTEATPLRSQPTLQLSAEPASLPTAETSTLDPLRQWDALQTELNATTTTIGELEASALRDLELVESGSQEPTDSQLKEDP